MKLTAAAIERIKPDPKRRLEIPDALLPGLYFVIQPSGARSWALRYRHAGRTRKYTIGTLATFPLADARETARKALQAVAAGRDPAAEKKAAREPEADLVVNVVAEFLNRYVNAKNKARTAEEVERRFKLHITPKWGKRRIQDIGAADLHRILDGLMDAGKATLAVHVRQDCNRLANWCVERGILEASPFARVKKPTVLASRDRILTDEELALVWRAAARLGYPCGTLVQLLALTGQRRDEVAGMRRSEIERDLWTIPGPRTKNGLPHEVPLAPAAKTLIDAAPRISGSTYVLTTTGDTPISGFAKAKALMDRTMLAIAKDEAQKTRRNDVDEITITPWRLHDLRRTLASALARMGEPVHVVEAILNHKSGTISGVAAVYNRHSYLPEKRAALERWAKHVTGLFDG